MNEWTWTEDVGKVMFFPIEIVDLDNKKSCIYYINPNYISHFYFDNHRIGFVMNNGENLITNKTFSDNETAIVYVKELLKLK